MQLLNGTLRCLRQLHGGGLNVKALLNKTVRAEKYSCCLTTLKRNYAAIPAVSLKFEQFDGPNSDAGKPPLITMHGLFGSKQNWRSVSKAMAAKTNRRIYTLDLRNHGDSPHADTHNSDGMTADLAAFMQANSIAKASLLGHSMGGRAAMHFALTYPQLVERLIVVDISPVSIPRTVGEMSSIFDAMMTTSIPADQNLSAGRQLAKQHLLTGVARDTVDFILLNLRKNPKTGEFYWACNVKVLNKSLHGFSDYGAHIAPLPPFQGPTSFICGTNSNYMDPADWPQVLQIFPNANIHWLDTGHLVHLEQPHQFIALTTTFLNSS